MDRHPLHPIRFITALWRKPLVPALVLVVMARVGGFLEVASEVGEMVTRSFDEAMLLAMREPGDMADPIGPPRAEEVARDLTALGGVTALSSRPASLVKNGEARAPNFAGY